MIEPPPPPTIPETRAARAADHPCELYAYHSPRVVRTDGHHIRPVYLQNRAHGRIVDPTLKWLCPNCHTAVHDWLSFLLHEARRPDPEPGRLAKAEAQASYDWFQSVRPR